MRQKISLSQAVVFHAHSAHCILDWFDSAQECAVWKHNVLEGMFQGHRKESTRVLWLYFTQPKVAPTHFDVDIQWPIFRNPICCIYIFTLPKCIAIRQTLRQSFEALLNILLVLLSAMEMWLRIQFFAYSHHTKYASSICLILLLSWLLEDVVLFSLLKKH